MGAQIIQLRDYQNPKDLERMRQALEREGQEFLARAAMEIMAPFVETTGFTDTSPSEMIPFGGAGIDGMVSTYETLSRDNPAGFNLLWPEKDPA